MTFETFDQSDEETWPDQKIPTYLLTHLPVDLPTYLYLVFSTLYLVLGKTVQEEGGQEEAQGGFEWVD